MEVEAKGTTENTRRHLELGLLRVKVSTPYVHPGKRGGYYRVHDERLLAGRKRDTHPTVSGFSIQKSFLARKAGNGRELGDPLSVAWAANKVKPDLLSRIDRTFPTRTG